MKQRFMLISTSDARSERGPELTRMINSVQASFLGAPHLTPVLYLLMQRCDADALKRISSEVPSWVRLKSIETQISLSEARNMLLSPEMAGSEIEPDDIVGFPDDDCWYPDQTLAVIADAFKTDPNLDFWFCRYGSAPQEPVNVRGIQPRLQTVISRASSNTIFVSGRVAKLIGGFDRQLGVGARLAGGEDTDYALRAFRDARKSLFLDLAAVGHRDPDKRFRAKYYPGALKAIAQNARGNLAGLQALVRKLLVGVLLILQRQMTASTYVFAISNILTSRVGR